MAEDAHSNCFDVAEDTKKISGGWHHSVYTDEEYGSHGRQKPHYLAAIIKLSQRHVANNR